MWGSTLCDCLAHPKMLGGLLCLLWLIHCSSAEIFAIKYHSTFYFEEYNDLPANFGKKIIDTAVRGMLMVADPSDGCTEDLKPPPSPDDVPNDTGHWLVIMPRYNSVKNCSFEQKVRMAQSAGYYAAIIYNVGSDELIPMGAKNKTGIYIPSVFISETDSRVFIEQYTDPQYYLVITSDAPFNFQTHLLIPFAIVVGICSIVMVVFLVVKCIKDRRRQARHRLPTTSLNKIPTCKYQKGDPYDTCAICLDDYVEGEKLRVLPCNHVYHTKCIDPWLTKNRRVCPICKRKVFAHDEPHVNSDSDSDSDDTTPLINSNNRGTQGGTFQDQTENPIQRAARSISQLAGGQQNFVTASDHHSINGDFQSCDSTSSNSSSSEDGGDVGGVPILASTESHEVHVHTSAGDDHDHDGPHHSGGNSVNV